MSSFRTATGLKTIAHLHVRDAANTLRAVTRAHLRTAAGLKTFFSAFAASADPGSVRGYGNSASTVTVTTPTTIATPAGGVGPYTYAWTRTDSDPQPWTITNSAGAETAFHSDVDAGVEVGATFICTVTDSTGATAATGEVTARAINLGGGL